MLNEMEGLKSRGESISLVNCVIQKSRYGEEFEVVASKRSSLVASPKWFNIDESELPLQRADQIANIIAGKFGLTTPLYVDKDLEEGDPAEPGTTKRFDIAYQKFKTVDITLSMTKIIVTHANVIRHWICR